MPPCYPVGGFRTCLIAPSSRGAETWASPSADGLELLWAIGAAATLRSAQRGSGPAGVQPPGRPHARRTRLRHRHPRHPLGPRRARRVARAAGEAPRLPRRRGRAGPGPGRPLRGRAVRRTGLRCRHLAPARPAHPGLAARPADGAHHRGRARLRDQRRTRRPALRPGPCRRPRGPLEPRHRAVREPLGLRDHQPLESGRGRPQPVLPSRQPRRGGAAAHGLGRRPGPASGPAHRSA